MGPGGSFCINLIVINFYVLNKKKAKYIKQTKNIGF